MKELGGTRDFLAETKKISSKIDLSQIMDKSFGDKAEAAIK